MYGQGDRRGLGSTFIPRRDSGRKKKSVSQGQKPVYVRFECAVVFYWTKKNKKNNPTPKQGPVTSSSMRGFVCKLEIFHKPDEAFHLSAIHFGASSSFDVSASDVWTSPSDKSDH